MAGSVSTAIGGLYPLSRMLFSRPGPHYDPAILERASASSQASRFQTELAREMFFLLE